MGGVSTPGGDGGLNVELNLVPFIDLLSSLVLFLLLGAVWVQIASMQAAVESKNGVHKSASKEVPLRVEVKITRRGYELKWPGKAGRMPASMALQGAVYDHEGLKTLITGAFKEAKINGGGVSAADDVPYGEVVVAIDALKQGGLTSVGLTTE
jgi:biopolymer transport protein TolR